MLKIVHINATDARGGAAIACMRLNAALQQAGMESSMIVANHSTGLNRILQSINFRINNPREKRLLSDTNFTLMDFGLPIYRNPRVREADIIFLHWVCANTLSIRGIEKILKLGKPTFWFMHDMFPFTGGCHYSLKCDGYKSTCTSCPQINNIELKDLACKQLRRKIELWNRYENLEFISPSNWEAECARQSVLCMNHKIHTAGNVIDTDVYHPMNNNCKTIFGLDDRKKTILFGATRINSPYKGANYAHECLCQLDPDKYEGLVIGRADEKFISDLPIKVIQTGFLSDDNTIAKAYNACDTFIMTSIAESFGQVVSEAMACGKPCVGFPTGGVLDLIRHKNNGYLTDNYDAFELKNGIDWIFSNTDKYNLMSEACRLQIIENNSFKKVLNIHKELEQYLNE